MRFEGYLTEALKPKETYQHPSKKMTVVVVFPRDIDLDSFSHWVNTEVAGPINTWGRLTRGDYKSFWVQFKNVADAKKFLKK